MLEVTTSRDMQLCFKSIQALFCKGAIPWQNRIVFYVHDTSSKNKCTENMYPVT